MGIPAPIGVSAAGLPPLGDQANAVVLGVLGALGPTPPFAFQGPMNIAIWAQALTALTTTAGSLSASVASATGLAPGTAINSANVPRGTTVGVISGTTVTLAIPPRSYPVSGFNTTGNRQVSLPPGSNVSQLLGATITASSPSAERLTLPAATTVTNIIQADVAPSLNSPGVPGIIQLSALPTLVPPESVPLFCDFAVTGNAIVTTGADAAATFTDAGLKWTGNINIESSFDGGRTFICCNIGGAAQLAQYLSQSSVRLVFGEPERQVLYRLNLTTYTPVAGLSINYRMSATGQAATSISVPAIA